MNGGVDEFPLVCKPGGTHCGDYSVLSLEGFLQVAAGKVGLKDGDAGGERCFAGGASQDGDIEVLGFQET